MAHPAKHLTTCGNSLALIVDRSVLAATGITIDTPLEVTAHGDVILVHPVRDEAHTAKLRAISDELFERYAGAFRRLAESERRDR
jgi:antitoxin component of MazEF toxin-antitoxin module